MKSRAHLLLADPLTVPKVPVWAQRRGLVLHDADAAYLAGAALNSLDNLVRQNPPWAGVWRQRLALQNATAAVNLPAGARTNPACATPISCAVLATILAPPDSS